MFVILAAMVYSDSTIANTSSIHTQSAINQHLYFHKYPCDQFRDL